MANQYSATEVADVPQEPGYYPNPIWHRQTDRYLDYWRYYDGEVLEDEVEAGVTESGKPQLQYPLKINWAKLAVQKHSYALLGEYDETGILEFHAKRRKKGEGVEDKPADEIDEFLEKTWDENNAMSIMPEQARIGHVCGGAVFKVAYDNRKETEVRLEVILPDHFFPVWDGSDYHNLLEAIVSYRIPTREAILKFGLEPDETTGDEVLYVERWTKEEYEVTVDGKPAKDKFGIEYEGKNPYKDPATNEGIIPFEYFPVNRTAEFYGTSIIPDIMGLQDEFNLRMADVGEAINEAVHPMRYGRNLPKQRKEVKLSRYKIVNLGQNPPNQDPPEVAYVEHPGLPEGTAQFLGGLTEAFREVAHTPPVAYGVDEGSQRSALTLAFRMWPTTAFTRDTRAFWTAGFASLNRKIMIIHMTKASTSKIRAEHFGYSIMTTWSPIIPRDREQLVNEQVLLVQTKLRSPETALRNLGDLDDIEAEIKKIKDWQSYLATLAQEMEPPDIEMERPKTQATVE